MFRSKKKKKTRSNHNNNDDDDDDDDNVPEKIEGKKQTPDCVRVCTFERSNR